MDLTLIILLLAMGIVFLLLELFFLPGISVAGFGGVACLVASVVLAFNHLGETAGCITLLGSLVAVILAIWWFFHSRTLKKMSLDTHIDAVAKPDSDCLAKPGDTGVCLSRLAPRGKVLINGHTLEAFSPNEMLDEGTLVCVISADKDSVVVRPQTS